ncbi:restriction endonuclease subunit S [Burkholderia pseudomallei]|uniref:restriction endonuclease subunit S n=1 Tax=Burkholderia pseudomallei TaxID=28450 RepID=UPI00135DB428|nr:restriction endonuclease subunit S [Burkholderia pseudomallei]MWA34795.1 restriction endonuclease subunit S [Burkholderia pseudomallei]
MADKWKIEKLSNLCEQIADCPHSTPLWTNSGVVVLRNQNIRNGRLDLSAPSFTDEAHYEQRSRRARLRAGDLVLTREAPMGEVCMIPDGLKCCLGQRMVMLRPNPQKSDSRYLLYAIQSDAVQHEIRVNEGTGSTVSNLRIPLLEALPIPTPPLPEQRAIAHILGTLDDKIELSRRRDETLEAMARALFKDWFVDFGPVRAKMEGREPYLPREIWDLFPKRLDDELPEGWKRLPASKLIEFNPAEPLRKGEVAPYLDMASLPTKGSWPEPYVLRPFGSGMRFRNGDTLLARITPCLENGKTAFIQCLPDNVIGWGSTEYIVMRPKAPVPAAFAYLLARDEAFRDHAIRSMTGTSGRQRAQGDSVAAYKIAAPSNEKLWIAFARLVTPLFDGIKVNSEASVNLAGMRDALLPKLISGEFRIKDAERFIEAAV